MEDDGTAVRHYQWSGVESIDPDKIFLEFPSENIETFATPISPDQAEPIKSNDVHAQPPPLMNLPSRTGKVVRRLWRGSIFLPSAASFVIGIVAGAAIVQVSGRSSASVTTVEAAPSQVVPSARPNVQVHAPARPSVASAVTRAHERTPQVLPARPPVAPARRTAFRGSMIVYSRPSGARVFLNGRGAGTTPLVLKNQSVGSRAVRIELDGYQTWTSAVQVVTNTSTSVRADLKPARE